MNGKCRCVPPMCTGQTATYLVANGMPERDQFRDSSQLVPFLVAIEEVVRALDSRGTVPAPFLNRLCGVVLRQESVYACARRGHSRTNVRPRNPAGMRMTNG